MNEAELWMLLDVFLVLAGGAVITIELVVPMLICVKHRTDAEPQIGRRFYTHQTTNVR
jgi:hypothetical protein